MLPSLAFATTTDIPELFNQLFIDKQPEAYELTLCIESAYIGRHTANFVLMSPPLFPLQMWNKYFMAQMVYPALQMMLKHGTVHLGVIFMSPPIDSEFLDNLKREHGLVEVKQAYYITGRKPSKRRCYDDREGALENLPEGGSKRSFREGLSLYIK